MLSGFVRSNLILFKDILWCEFQICAHIDFPSSEIKVDEFEMWQKCGKSRHAFQGPLEYGSKSSPAGQAAVKR